MRKDNLAINKHSAHSFRLNRLSYNFKMVIRSVNLFPLCVCLLCFIKTHIITAMPCIWIMLLNNIKCPMTNRTFLKWLYKAVFFTYRT